MDSFRGREESVRSREAKSKLKLGKTVQNLCVLLAEECLVAFRCLVAHERGRTEPVCEHKGRAQFESTECWNGCLVLSAGELCARQPLQLYGALPY